MHHKEQNKEKNDISGKYKKNNILSKFTVGSTGNIATTLREGIYVTWQTYDSE